MPKYLPKYLPGLHSLSMDDHAESATVRLRNTSMSKVYASHTTPLVPFISGQRGLYVQAASLMVAASRAMDSSV